MIVGTDTDLCVTRRFEATLRRRPGIAKRILTSGERTSPVQSQTAWFVAKEAPAKVLGGPGGISWLDVEVARSEAGAPSFVVTGTMAERVAELDVIRIHPSASHDGGFATVTVVYEV